MTPYYEDTSSGIVIYCGDCRDVLPSIRPEAMDAVVTDPPYGIGLSNNDKDGHRAERDYAIEGDEDGSAGIAALAWAEAHELPTIAFASPWKPWPGQWRNLITWDKGGAVGGGGDISTCLKRSWELVQVARNKMIYGARSESVWRYPITEQDTRIHIAAKPVELMTALLEKFVAPRARVIDPFLGSGSTLVAAKLTGRSGIGIEKVERYCTIAVNRLRQEVLFGAA